MAGLCESGNEPLGSLKASLEQPVFIFDKFVKYESCVIKFRQSFPDSPEPSNAIIYNYLVKKFRTIGLVLDKKRTCVNCNGVRTRVRQGARQTKRWYGERLDAERVEGRCTTAAREGRLRAQLLRAE
ncbi:hypothetical protein ANN_01287 [Periplaneta americana]|uniref:Uncharacterized protein n=1 Tax=Periplaneta americana TaxID=6978 RepID=A0ABQ8TVK4_PERAM|nr:hypothetical protein ANN_01287 [Periplaneta americana]